MRLLPSACGLLLISAALAGAVIYDAHVESRLGPAVALAGDDVYVAFARLDGTLKFGRFELSQQHGGQADLVAAVPMTNITAAPFAMTVADKSIFLAWVDYRDGDVLISHYRVKGKEDFEHVDTRTTNISPIDGVSLVYDDGRVYLGYTDGADKVVKITTFKISSKGKISREGERELRECETGSGAAVTLEGDTLVVAWIDEDKKYMLTTYAVDKSSKGASFNHLKDVRTEIKVRTDPQDKPALASAEGEIFLAYIDKNDQTAHVNFYTLESDGWLKSAGNDRVNERPGYPVAIAVKAGGQMYMALVDRNNSLYIAKE